MLSRSGSHATRSAGARTKLWPRTARSKSRTSRCARPRGIGARRMHGTPCARSHRRAGPRTGSTRCTWSWPLEDRTPALNAMRSRSSRRCRVDWTRAGLRHHHTPHRRSGSRRSSSSRDRQCACTALDHAGNGFNRRSLQRHSIGQRRLCWHCGRRRLSNRRGSPLRNRLSWLNLSRRRRMRRYSRRNLFRRSRSLRNRCCGNRSRCMYGSRSVNRGRVLVRRSSGRMCLRRCSVCCARLSRGRRDHHHGRSRNHRSHRWPSCNRWRRRCGNHDLCVLPWLRHDPPRSNRRRRRYNRSAGWRRGLCHRLCNHGRSRRHGTAQLRVARLFFGLLARQNCLYRVTRLGDVGQIEGWLGLYHGLGRSSTAAPTTEVVAHLFSLVGLDRTGVRLRLRDANRSQSVQNGSALDFQLSCKIVDSNFTHPSLFISSARLAVHISLIEVGIWCCSVL